MRRFLSALSLCLLAAACRDLSVEGTADAVDGAPACLEFTVSIPQVATKSGEPGYADGNVSASDAVSWNEWDRLVDGQSFYRLTLFLVKLPENTLVGYRDLQAGADDYCDDADGYGLNGFCDASGTLLPKATRFATHARVHFNYLHPMHGNSERLGSGEYRIYAVANYSPVSSVPASGSVTKSYGGLTAGSGDSLDDIVNGTGGILDSFDGSAGGLAGFDTDGYPDFFNYPVKAAQTAGVSDFVCAQEPQPLTFMKDVVVLSGNNVVEMQLVRTYSRIRIVLNNESASETLTLNSFSFDSHFSSDGTVLFDFGTDDKYAAGTAGSPVLQSTHAIHPYAGDGVTTVAPGASAVVFDAYVLESKLSLNDEKYRYRLDVSYHETLTTNYYIYDGKPIRSIDDLQTAMNNKCSKFLILQNGVGKGFLYDSDGSVLDENYNGDLKFLEQNVKVTSKSDLTLQPVSGATFRDIDLHAPGLRKYVWSVQRANPDVPGDWNIYVQNIDTERYWSDNIVVATTPRLSTVLVGYRTYRVEEWSQAGLVFRDMGTPSTAVYLHKDRYGIGSKSKDCLWAMYAIDDGVPARADKVITLQVVDPDTLQPVDLEEFRRNDFITVNIFTSIHPDGGTLEFKAVPWQAGGGNFNYE